MWIYSPFFQGEKFVQLWNSVSIVCVRLLMRSTRNFMWLQLFHKPFRCTALILIKVISKQSKSLEFTVAENFINYCFKHISLFKGILRDFLYFMIESVQGNLSMFVQFINFEMSRFSYNSYHTRNNNTYRNMLMSNTTK